MSIAIGNFFTRYASSVGSILGFTGNKLKDNSYVRMGRGSSSGTEMKSRKRDLESGIGRGVMEADDTTMSVEGGLGDDQVPPQVPKGGIGYSRTVDVK